MSVYLDTAAAAKLVVRELETAALQSYLDALAPADGPVANVLLETELRRLAVRLEIPQSTVSTVLERVSLVEPDRALYVEAGLLPGPHLRSLDALHLATAVRVDARVLVTYDVRLQAAARSVGLATAAPGSDHP